MIKTISKNIEKACRYQVKNILRKKNWNKIKLKNITLPTKNHILQKLINNYWISKQKSK